MKWTGRAPMIVNRIIGTLFLAGAIAVLVRTMVRFFTGQPPTWGLLIAFVLYLIGTAAILD